MKLKKLGLALVAVLALGAVMASSASAARAVTQDVTWTIEGAVIPEKVTESVSSTGSGTLITRVGTTPLELSATGINCVGCTIQNNPSAVGAGALEFTGVTVKTPAVCAARSVGAAAGIVKTNSLEVEADYMKEKEKEPNYILFKPAGGATQFVEIELLKGSGSCPIAGKYKVTGEVFVESVNGTGVDSMTQTVESSEAINIEASGKTEPLQFGGVAAVLKGSASFALSGTSKNKSFGTK